MRSVKFCLSSLLLWSSFSSADSLLILGDSLSAAYGIEPQSGWVNLLAQQLPEHQIHNASVSGETTDGGLERLPRLLQTLQPDWVLIELGGNDGLRGYPVQRIGANLNAMIDVVRQAGAQPILMEMMIPANYGERYGLAFQALYAELANRRQVPLLEFFLEDIGLDPALMQDDGIHPTAAAQPLIARRVLAELRPLLQTHAGLAD